ncbi:MAG: Flagellar regulatory protein FleQ [Labilithrix sp.]|nr:Flagellar regulatory protein FleQ [Labilithrix sp.]
MSTDDTKARPSPAARVLVHNRARLRVVAGPDVGKELELGDRTSAVIGTHPDCDLVLSDTTVSRRHFEVRAQGDGYAVSDLGSTNGVRIAGVLVRDAHVDGDLARLEVGDTVLELVLSEERVEHALSEATSFGSVIGASPPMRSLYSTLERVARTDATVLVHGESGTGKELIVESIHAASPRASGPLVVVDCSAIPSNLVESELFGYEKGAFTGAIGVKPGAVEEAHGGTLFLDELGELPLDLQPKFLRFLEGRQVRRVGGTRWKDVDVRVIAATHRDLSKAVAAGTFRSDLYYRVAVVKLAVPPLRHRIEDVPLLAHHFVRRTRPDLNPAAVLTRDVTAALQAYAWPGNVRELRNVIERLLALGDLASQVRIPTTAAPSTTERDYHAARRDAIERFEREYARGLLYECGGVVSRAAARAGISRQMFHRLLQKHGLGGGD